MLQKFKYLVMHLLVYRAVHNINRDDRGRPKSCNIGGTERGRHSSQSWKAIIAKFFRELTELETSQQTALIGRNAYEQLLGGGIDKEKAEEYAFGIISAFSSKKKKNGNGDKEDKKEDGKKKKKDNKDILKMETIKIQDCEIFAVNSLLKKIIEGYVPEKSDYDFLRVNESIDNALFGRMLAARPGFDIEAAMAVAHGFTVNECTTEEDYFTATDSLQNALSSEEGKVNKGSAHLDKAFFAEGVFYHSYILDVDLLVSNLGGNVELAEEVIRTLLEVSAMASPTASKNRGAGSQAPSGYMMVEKCDKFPRQLAVAFQDAIEGPKVFEKAIEALEDTKRKFDKVYYELPSKSFNFLKEEGNLKDVIDFAVEDLQTDKE